MKVVNTYYENFNSLSQFVQNNQEILWAHNNSALLIQVFHGLCDRDFLRRLLAELTGLFPQAFIIGTTTSGEIMNGKVSGLKTVLSFSIFGRTTIQTGFFQKDHLNDFELGQKIGSVLGSDQAKLLILFSTGNPINSNLVLKGVASLYPELPIAGGNAGYNDSVRFISCGEQITNCGVVGAILEGENLQVHCYSNLGWQPIGKEMTITKVDGLCVCTIDNIPAYQIYRKYLGLDIYNFTNTMEYPLLVRRHGSLIARTPNSYHGDGSLSFEEEFVEGEKIRLSFGDVGLISEEINSLCQEIRRYSAESIFIYSCECRRGFLQELSEIETEPLQKLAKTSGFFTYGEFYYNKVINQVLNATMTVVVLAETSKKVPDYGSKIENENLGPNYQISKDKLVARRTDVLKALTHLINTVTAELMAANEKLQYIGLHDALSGLYNRTFFEQQMQRLEADTLSVGIIICDMDGLKMINDTLGHHFGDQMICAAAKVIYESCRKDAFAVRIGGDEFAILLPNSSLPELKNVSKKIKTLAAKYRRAQPTFFLYLSVGFALRESGGTMSLTETIKIADANMYHHKKRNRHYIKKKFLEKITLCKKSV